MRGLVREDDVEVFNPAPAELAAHDAREGAARGLGQVGYAQALRVELAARAEGGDYRDAAAKGGLDEVKLAADEVDAVCDVVEALRQDAAVFGVVQRRDGPYVRLGRNVAQPRGEGFGLGQPHGGAQGLELAVDVALGDEVGVYERERADTGAAERFGAPGAHAAQPDDRDARAHKPLRRRAAQQHLHALRPLHNAPPQGFGSMIAQNAPEWKRKPRLRPRNWMREVADSAPHGSAETYPIAHTVGGGVPDAPSFG